MASRFKPSAWKSWSGVVLGVAFGVALGVALGVVGGVAVGVAFGVALGVALGVAVGVALGVAVGVAVGVVLGVALGVAGGVALGVAAGVAFGVALGVAGGVAFGVAGGVAVGVALGVALGVAGGVAGGVALGVSLVLVVTHLLNLFVQWPQTIISGLVARNLPGFSRPLWRISPVRWDDVILLPLPGLVTLLTVLQRQYPQEGQQALKEVAAHKYQRKAAHQVLARLAQEDARQITSLPALASYERGLDWLSETVLLPDEARQRLLQMRDISREVASAQESDSATNRVRRLEAAQAILESLRTNPGEFGQTLAIWSPLVAAALDDARRRQRIEEPIPQIYAQDGKAIAPGNRRDDEVPFKGRKALITQLELALGGSAGERSTLLLYGQRRTGKTSVLLQLPRRLGGQFVPVFVDLQSGKFGANDAAGYLGGLADVIADEALAKRNLALPRINRRALSRDAYPAWDAWLEDVERTLDHRTLLICLDEFEALEEAIHAGRIDERLLNLLRHVTQHRHSISMLLSGSHQIDELPSHWAKALVGTTVLPISFLEEADARELIECPVKDFPDIYAAEASDEIIRLTHRQPYYIQLVCAQLVERMNRAHRLPPESRVTLDDVKAVIPVALERGQGYFSDLWQNHVGSEAGRQILEALVSHLMRA